MNSFAFIDSVPSWLCQSPAAQGEVAQVKIEAGDRPVRPLQAGVGYIKAANL